MKVMSSVTVMSALSTWQRADNAENDEAMVVGASDGTGVGADVGTGVGADVGTGVTVGIEVMLGAAVGPPTSVVGARVGDGVE